MHEPLVSVVLPVRNCETFVHQAIASILAQTLEDFELLVVDDGSLDHTNEIARGHLGDVRVKLLASDRPGLVGALRTGIRASVSKLIARMDADDLALPRRLEAQYSYLVSHPDVGALGTSAWLIDEADAIVGSADVPAETSLIERALQHSCPLLHPSVMMRKGVYLSTGGYRPEYEHAEDYDLWLRINEVSKLANLPARLLKYRLSKQQVSVRHVREQALSGMCARLAARAREANLQEPAVPVGGPTEEFLMQLGCSRQAVEHHVLLFMLRAANQRRATHAYSGSGSGLIGLYETAVGYAVERGMGADALRLIAWMTLRSEQAALPYAVGVVLATCRMPRMAAGKFRGRLSQIASRIVCHP